MLPRHRHWTMRPKTRLNYCQAYTTAYVRRVYSDRNRVLVLVPTLSSCFFTRIMYDSNVSDRVTTLYVWCVWLDRVHSCSNGTILQLHDELMTDLLSDWLIGDCLIDARLMIWWLVINDWWRVDWSMYWPMICYWLIDFVDCLIDCCLMGYW